MTVRKISRSVLGGGVLRRRLKRKGVSLLTAILFVILFAFWEGREGPDSRDNDNPATGGLYLCTQVTDGDTIKVIFQGQEERVRILDIDAPEVRRSDKLRKQALEAGISEDKMVERGRKASRKLESMVLGKHIRLQFQPGEAVQRDNFGRLLCHVSVDGTNVASHLLSLGLVEVYGE